MTTIRRIMEVWETGNSLVMTIKSKDVQELQLKAGDHVEVTIAKLESEG